MADVALRPTFPKDELERLRQQRLTTLVQTRDNPDAIASLVLSRVLYGPAHRFGTATVGTTETMRAFTIEDLRGFYNAAFRPDNSALLIVGDVAWTRVLPLVESIFGAWKTAGPVEGARQPFRPPPDRTTREIYLVDKPGAAQSQIRIGRRRAAVDAGLLPDSGDEHDSRRRRSFEAEPQPSRSTATRTARAPASTCARRPARSWRPAGVQTDKTSEALKEFFNELNGILQPVPADELARAKNYVALRFPGAFETTGDISRRLEDALVYHLPDDYFSKYVQNIEAVTAADVQRVAQKYVQPDRLAVVVVGIRK